MKKRATGLATALVMVLAAGGTNTAAARDGADSVGSISGQGAQQPDMQPRSCETNGSGWIKCMELTNCREDEAAQMTICDLETSWKKSLNPWY